MWCNGWHACSSVVDQVGVVVMVGMLVSSVVDPRLESWSGVV